MQTFLPYPDFYRTAKVLDYRRLGKQRVEAKQIYLALTDSSYGWQNHPAVKMWRGYHEYLACYGFVICLEWRLRGYKDSLISYFQDIMNSHCLTIYQGLSHKMIIRVCGETIMNRDLPSWMGDDNFHRSHQSNLIRKDPGHYGPEFPGVPNNLPYIWPN